MTRPPLTLVNFAQPWLPLGTPVTFVGLACRIVGRSFSRESYDLEVLLGEPTPGKPHLFWNVTRGEFEVDIRRLGAPAPLPEPILTQPDNVFRLAGGGK